MSAPAISVVIPARDASATIGRTLAALDGQRTSLPYEVIVIDSGSHDETPALVQRSGATLLSNPGGEPAGSRNLGVSHARAELIAFTDADCEPEPEWLERGARALRDAELVQGAVRPAEVPRFYDRTVSVGAESGLYETANLFVTRAAFERAGGFQPVPGLGIGEGQPFGEDAWFGWRVRRAGHGSVFEPGAVVRHAVFPRGPSEWIAERARCRYFPPLVALIPELRETFLHRRVFLSPASLRFDAALIGLWMAGRTRRRAGLLLSLPYVLDVVAEARGTGLTRDPRWVGSRICADALTLGALLAGSARARTAVL